MFIAYNNKTRRPIVIFIQ